MFGLSTWCREALTKLLHTSESIRLNAFIVLRKQYLADFGRPPTATFAEIGRVVMVLTAKRGPQEKIVCALPEMLWKGKSLSQARQLRLKFLSAEECGERVPCSHPRGLSTPKFTG